MMKNSPGSHNYAHADTKEFGRWLPSCHFLDKILNFSSPSFDTVMLVHET